MRAVNPQTGEQIEWDGKAWVPVAPPSPPPPPAPESAPATFGDILGGVNRGASLGLSEMAIPAGTAAYKALTEGAPFGETYAREKQSRYDQAQKFRAGHPWVNLGSEMTGGGMLGMAGGMKSTLGWAAKHPFLASVPAGAAYGGIYGGATAPPGEALPGAGQGAAVGAVAGPIGYGLGRGIQGAIAGARRAMTPKASRILQREVLDPAGITGEGAAAAMQKSGPGTTALEVTGTPGMRMAQGITGKSPAAAQRIRNVVDSRLAGRWERIQGDMKRLLGKEGGTFHKEFKQIAERRANQASPYYKAAREDSVNSEQARGYLDYLKGEMAQYEGTTLGGALSKVQRMMAKTVKGKKVVKTNVGTELHAVKMQMDDMIDTAVRQGQGNRARVLMGAKNELLSMMDKASPNYSKGRELFSGDSSIMNAMELGRKVLREDAEVTQMALQNMSQGEKDAYLVGAAKALRDAAGSKPPQSFYRHGGIKERLAFAFPDEKSLDEFLNVSLTREAKLGELSTKILHGSQTQPRQEAVEGLAMGVEDFFEGQPAASGLRIIRAIRNTMKGQYSDEMIQELTDLLVEDRPEVFAKRASQVLKPEDFVQMRKMFTMTGMVIGAEGATRATQ